MRARDLVTLSRSAPSDDAAGLAWLATLSVEEKVANVRRLVAKLKAETDPADPYRERLALAERTGETFARIHGLPFTVVE